MNTNQKSLSRKAGYNQHTTPNIPFKITLFLNNFTGNVKVNWIDQILGHALINSRDAYSKPTDEQLKDAYKTAYNFLRVYSEFEESKKFNHLEESFVSISKQDEENLLVAEAKNFVEVKQPLARGYKYKMEFEGVKLFIKK
ncbi:MAG: hypothetical protein ACFCUE_02670 [Candidatus Bathyarchaeia archaeon]|jgi:hypothetical protein